MLTQPNLTGKAGNGYARRISVLGRVGPRLRNRAQLRKARGNSENDVGAEISRIHRNQKSRGQSSYNHFECQHLTSPLKSREPMLARSVSGLLRGVQQTVSFTE